MQMLNGKKYKLLGNVEMRSMSNFYENFLTFLVLLAKVLDI